jgi:hypothetical protein
MNESAGNDEIQHIVNELAMTKGTARRLRLLREELEEQPAGSSTFVIDDFLRHGLNYNAMKLESVLLSPIQKAFFQFIGVHLYNAFKDKFPFFHSSAKQTSHLLVASNVREMLVECFSRAWIDGMKSTADRSMLRQTLLNDIESVWTTQCVPLIQAERASLKRDLFDISSACVSIKELHGRIEALLKTRLSDNDSAFEFAKHVERAHAYIFERIRNDPWTSTSKIIWKSGMLKRTCACNVETNQDVFQNMQHMLEDVLESLENDRKDIENILSVSVNSVCWHGIEINERVDDPLDGFMLLRPSFGAFESSTGRVYFRKASHAPGEPRIRACTVLQVVHVAKELASNSWLTIGKISTEYAVQLALNEYNDLLFNFGQMKEHLVDVLRQLGKPSNKEDVDEMIHDANAVGGSKISTPQAVAAAAAADGASSTSVDTEEPPPPRLDICSPALANPVEFVSGVCLRSNSTRFLPDCVAPSFLIDYLTIHTALSRVTKMIDLRSRGSALDVNLTSRELVATVECLLERHQHRMPHKVTRDRLIQTVPACVHRLLSEGFKGCNASPLSVAWNATFKPSENNNALKLTVGHGSHDDACVVFCFVCNAVMFHLDSNWPLPTGMQWPATRQRPLRKPKSKTNATRDVVDKDETGEGGSTQNLEQN